MNKTYFLPAAFFLFLLNVSCSQKQDQTSKVLNNQPNLIQEVSGSMRKLYRGSGSMVEELYAEQLEKNKDLKLLEETIEQIRLIANLENDTLNSYNEKSTRYYADALQLTNAVTDSLVKREMLALIKKSQLQFEENTKSQKLQLNKINQLEKSINAWHTLLKLSTTLPVLKSYQDQNSPDSVSLMNVAVSQNQVLNQIKKQIRLK